MKGLLKKDAMLIFSNYKTYVVVLLISGVYMFMGNSGATFFAAYITMMAGLLVVTTLSYDDFDHGMTFLLTLPVKRSDYVKEKYAFALLSAAGGCLISLAAGFFRLKLPLTGTDTIEWCLTVFVYLLCIVVVQMFMLPLQFRFGRDSARMLIVAVFMAAAIAVIFGKRLLGMFGTDIDRLLTGVGQWINSLNAPAALAGCLTAVAAGLLISYRVSVHIIEKKEY